MQCMELSGFTTETQRSRREDFFICRGGADRQKPSVWNKSPWPKAHEDISLSLLRVSNESRLVGRVGGENRFEC